MWEAITALIHRLDAGHLAVIVLFVCREWLVYQERKLFGEALSKLVESMNGVKVVVAAITGKSQ